MAAGAETAVEAAGTPKLPAERPVDPSKSGRDRAPIVHFRTIDQPPTIDADLSDPCWQQAYHTNEFWDTDGNCAPTEITETWICGDGENLYVAVYSRDTQPSLICCQEKKRNGDIWSDDFLEINLDPTYTQGGAYTFQVTPRGTMRESVPGGSDAKVEWRGDWSAAGRIVDDGWVCEIAVPWAILRYPAGQSEIGLCVSRRLQRTERWFTWPNMGAGWDGTERARMVGLAMPRVRRPLLVMPNIQAEWTEDYFRNNIGLDFQKTFENGLTAVGTWAPDYRNIEDEVESIDFSYTERYYRDRRPFFTTGGGYMPGRTLLYSRRIEDLDLGLKAFGRINSTDVGLLQTFTFGERNDTGLRVRQRVDDHLNAKVDYVRRDVSGEPLNNAWELDLSWYDERGTGGLSYGAEYTGSATEGAPGGYRWEATMDRWRGWGHWGYYAGYEAISPDFDPQNGYEPEVDRKGFHGGFNYNDSPDEGYLKHYYYNVWGNYNEHFDGSLFTQGYGVSTGLTRREQRDGVRFNTGWTDRPPHNDHTTSIRYWWGDGRLHEGGSIGYNWGDLASADYENYYGSLSWIFKEDFYGSLRYERRISDYWDPAEKDEDIDRLTLGLNYDFDEERGWGLSLRTGTIGTNVFATYRQAVREGMDWFVIFGDPNTDDTQARFAVKTKWIWKY